MNERTKIESELLDALKEKPERVQLRLEENLPDGVAGTVEITLPLPCTIGDLPTLPAYKPTLDGYVFSGWNTKPDGTGDKYDPGQTLTEDLTLYAQWLAPEPPPPTPEPTLESTPKPAPGQDGETSNGEADADPQTEE